MQATTTRPFLLARAGLFYGLLLVAFLSLGAREPALAIGGPGPEGALDLEEDAERRDDKKEETGLDAILRMVGALALVLALIVLTGLALRRYAKIPGSTSGRSDSIRVVATKMLDGRRSLMLVRVRGQTLLLGLTPQSIHCLMEIHEIEGEWAQPADGQGASAPPSSFDNQLGKFVNQSIADESSDSTFR